MYFHLVFTILLIFLLISVEIREKNFVYEFLFKIQEFVSEEFLRQTDWISIICFIYPRNLTIFLTDFLNILKIVKIFLVVTHIENSKI